MFFLMHAEPFGRNSTRRHRAYCIPDAVACRAALVHALSSNSVRYFEAIAPTLALNAACAASSSLGGGIVRVATGVPTSRKNSSWPAGEQMQSILAGSEDEL